MGHEIPTAQLRAWLLTAIVPVILSVAGKNSWLTVLIMALVCGALSFCVLSRTKIALPKWLCILEILWLTVFLGGIARFSGSCWGSNPLIPIILLMLATFASTGGAFRSARIGATLLWLVLPVLGIVFLAGTSDINTNWMTTELELPSGVLLALLLYPCTMIFLPGKGKSLRWIGLIFGVVAVAGSILICGTLGVSLARSEPNGFYEFCKGITLFGVAERFEALVACALTGGFFALLTLILSTICQLGAQISDKTEKIFIWICSVASAGLMYILPNSDYWMAIGGVIFWGFLPVAAQGIGVGKNIEKK